MNSTVSAPTSTPNATTPLLGSNTGAQTTNTTLIVTQIITCLLLVVSELLPLTNSPYQGILHAVIGVLQNTFSPQQRIPVIVAAAAAPPLPTPPQLASQPSTSPAAS